MNHALTYSIVAYLKSQVFAVSNRVYWMYDGITLTDKTKPFVTVEQLATGNELLAAGRTAYEEVHAWTIGIRARTVAERTTLAETVRTALRQSVPFYDTSGASPVLTASTFVIDVGDTVPIPQEDNASETDKHRAYIDVTVTVYRTNGSGLTFSQ